MRVDIKGYRLNVGIILVNDFGKLFWGQRVQLDAWQFPQGGLREGEDLLHGMYRELEEETGLLPEHVKILRESNDWYSYDLPSQYIRRNKSPLVIGQKQKWYLLKLIADDSCINLGASTRPEFINYTWVDSTIPAKEVIYFKQDVYKQVLEEFTDIIGK